MQTVPEWDREDPATIGQLVEWFIEAEKNLDEPHMKEYVSGRWVYHVNRIAEEQGVTAGWLSYMVSSLVVEGVSGKPS